MLETQVIKLLHEFMKADNGAIYTWEIAIFYPATNAFLHYLAGVNISLQNNNYMSAMANVRGLIESLGAVVYDGTARLPEEAYDWFIKNGRLPKWNEKKKKWEALTINDTVASSQKAVDPKININKIYAACCDLNHFSSKHMSFLGGFEPQLDDKNRMLTFKIGSKDDIPVKEQREVIDFCATLCNVLGECIRLATKERTSRPPSKKP